MIIAHKDITIQLIAKSDRKAFRQLFEIYYQKLFHSALYFVKNKELAEEIVSDVFVKIWENRKSLTSIDNIETYFYVLTKNQSLQILRKKRFTVSDDIDELYKVKQIEEITTPESNYIENEYLEYIQKAILALPPKSREIYRLFCGEQMKQKNIALILDISQKTVEYHIAEAKKKISLYIKNIYTK